MRHRIVALQEQLPQSFPYPWTGLEAFIATLPGQTLPFVGYGSLINSSSASITIHNPGTTRTPWLAFGCKRIFNYEMPPAALSRYGSPRTPFERAALNVQVTHDCNDLVNGVLITLSADDVAALRTREVGYDFLPVVTLPWDGAEDAEPTVGYILSAPDVAAKPEWQIVNNRLLPHPAYRKICQHGASQISPQFLREFLGSTYLADRQTSLKEWKHEKRNNWQRVISTGSVTMRFEDESTNPSSSVLALDSEQGRQWLRESRHAEAFYRLVHYFNAQQNLDYCGVASSVMVLNALPVPRPTDAIHAPYPFFTQDNFFSPAVCKVLTPQQAAASGMNLQQLAAVLNANTGVVATPTHASAASLDAFRDLALAHLNSATSFILVNYNRPSIRQQGGGHISPIAAYHQGADAFLILDVSQYKYPPSWVPAAMLWSAMSAIDPGSNMSRGYVMVSAASA